MLFGIIAALWLAAWALASWDLHQAKRELRDAGLPLTIEEFLPPDLPASENGAPLLEQAGLLAEAIQGRKDHVNFLLGSGNPETDPLNFDAAGLDRMRAQIEGAEMQGLLKLLREASGKDGARFHRDASKGLFMDLSPMNTFFTTSRMLLNSAWLSGRDGNGAQAASDLAAGSRLASFMLEDLLLITWLVGSSQDSAVVDMAARVLSVLPEGSFHAEDWQGLHNIWTEHADAARGRFVRVLDGERLLAGAWMIENLLAGKYPEMELDQAAGAYCQIFPAYPQAFRLACRFPLRPMLIADYAAYLRFVLRNREEAANLASEETASGVLMDAIPNYALLTRLSAPAFDGVRKLLDEYQVKLQLGRIGIRLEEYRAEHGAYPDSLEQLGLTTKDLIDPFSGQPLLYKAEENGVLLYSVGHNRSDDNGQGRPAENRDIVWRVERQAQLP